MDPIRRKTRAAFFFWKLRKIFTILAIHNFNFWTFIDLHLPYFYFLKNIRRLLSQMKVDESKNKDIYRQWI